MRTRAVTSFILFFLLTAVSPLFSQATILLNLKFFPMDYTLEVDGEAVTPFAMPEDKKGLHLSNGVHSFHFSAEGYRDKTVSFNCDRNGLILEGKLEKIDSPLQKIGTINTGYCPKAVEFTPDGKYIVTTLLEGPGIQVFSATTLEQIDVDPVPAEYAAKKGFVEVAFVESLHEMWVSQMTTGLIHVYDYRDFSYKLSMQGYGTWSKVITISNDETRAYLSNWVSNDVSVFDIPNHKYLNRLHIGGTPRGMAVSEDDANTSTSAATIPG